MRRQDGTVYTLPITPGLVRHPRPLETPGVSAQEVRAEAERNRERWVRETLEGLEHARRHAAPLSKHWPDEFQPIRDLIERVIDMVS